MRGVGAVAQCREALQSAGRAHRTDEQQNRREHHYDALHGIRLHHGNEPAGYRIADDDYEDEHDRGLVRDLEKHLDQGADAFEYRGHVEEAREEHDHRGGHPRRQTLEAKADEVGNRQRPESRCESTQPRRHNEPGDNRHHDGRRRQQ